MTKAIRVHAYGGPEVMKWEDVPTPEPGPGEVAIKQDGRRNELHRRLFPHRPV